jgi:hypothetical protein
LRVYLNGEPAPVEIVKDGLTKEIHGGGGDQITIGERFRDRGFKNGLVDEFRVFGRELAPLEVRELTAPGTVKALWARKSAMTPGERSALEQLYMAAGAGPWSDYLEKVEEARKAANKHEDAHREIMVMRELPKPKPAYILFRGEYAERREEVFAETPAALGKLGKELPRNRLGLAKWLTAPEHPLLARVTVNRVWQNLWGIGLVKTAEDFGSQSIRPEYPELLDALAREFIDSGWDLKQLVRQIVLSRTYRQRSVTDGKELTDDPENRFLTRGPRHRLSAEMIRDGILAASGILVERIGGAPVKTYDMPESFKPSPAGKGADLYRRSIYTHWKRTGSGPVLETFDVPKRVVCVARRDTTNTPLQALVLMNAPQFVEASRILAEGAYVEAAGDVKKTIAAMFWKLVTRAPQPAEQKTLEQLYQRQLARYQQEPKLAEDLLSVGEKPRNPAVPVAEAAAATVVANALMNFDPVVVKR